MVERLLARTRHSLRSGGGGGASDAVRLLERTETGEVVTDRLITSKRLLSQQGLDNRAPFVGETAGRGHLSRVTVPIPRVREVTFTTMQVCVHPGGVVGVDVLSDLVRARPDRKSTRLNSSHVEISYA